MKRLFLAVLGSVALLWVCNASGQDGKLQLPHTVTAGSAFSIATSGSGKATLYIVGPSQALGRTVEMGQPIAIAAGELYNAGHYVVALQNGSSTETEELDVTPSPQPGTLGFLAKPSRLPVSMRNGISGAIYVFDAYRNLILTPLPASLELSVPSGSSQSRTVTTRNGLAWATLDSSGREGAAKFTARVGSASSTRVIQQVPGDPCRITITARPVANRLEVETAPVRDCSGNAIPDGTIVTFTERFNDTQSTVDVPLKEGVAKVSMPANPGAKISAASGVVAGNEIRWEGGR